MTRITTTPLAVSADYRDALVAARRAKNWLFLVLLLFLLAQVTIFFLAKFTDIIKIGPGGTATVTTPTKIDIEGDVDVEAPTTGESPATGDSPATAPTTVPADAAATPAAPEGDPSGTTGGATTGAPPLMAVGQGGTADADVSLNVGTKDVTTRFLAWVTNSIVYLGTIFSILMAVVILLIVLIMLVGRFEGMSSSTSAFVWMALLALLLFPWQLCYAPETGAGTTTATATSASSTASTQDSDMNDFRVPGVFYTWGELRRDVKFANEPLGYAVQKWARFAGFPVLALLVLFAVQAKSGRAVKVALGEVDVHVDVATTDV